MTSFNNFNQRRTELNAQIKQRFGDVPEIRKKLQYVSNKARENILANYRSPKALLSAIPRIIEEDNKYKQEIKKQQQRQANKNWNNKNNQPQSSSKPDKPNNKNNNNEPISSSHNQGSTDNLSRNELLKKLKLIYGDKLLTIIREANPSDDIKSLRNVTTQQLRNVDQTQDHGNFSYPVDVMKKMIEDPSYVLLKRPEKTFSNQDERMKYRKSDIRMLLMDFPMFKPRKNYEYTDKIIQYILENNGAHFEDPVLSRVDTPKDMKNRMLEIAKFKGLKVNKTFGWKKLVGEIFGKTSERTQNIIKGFTNKLSDIEDNKKFYDRMTSVTNLRKIIKVNGLDKKPGYKNWNDREKLKEFIHDHVLSNRVSITMDIAFHAIDINTLEDISKPNQKSIKNKIMTFETERKDNENDYIIEVMREIEFMFAEIINSENEVFRISDLQINIRSEDDNMLLDSLNLKNRSAMKYKSMGDVYNIDNQCMESMILRLKNIEGLGMSKLLISDVHDQLKAIDSTYKPGEGVSTQLLFEWVKKQKYISVYALDPMMRVFKYYKAETTKYSIMYGINSDHAYEITDKHMKNQISQPLCHCVKKVVSYPIDIKKGNYVVWDVSEISNKDDITPSLNKIITSVRKLNVDSNNEDESAYRYVIISGTHSIQWVAGKISKDTNVVCEHYKWTSGNMTSFIHSTEKIIFVLHNHIDVCMEIADTLLKITNNDEFKFSNQSIAALGSMYFKHMMGSLPESVFSQQAMYFMHRYPIKALIQRFSDKLVSPFEYRFELDVCKSYPHAAISNNTEFDVYTAFDTWEPYTYEHNDGISGYYLLERPVIIDTQTNFHIPPGRYPANLIKRLICGGLSTSNKDKSRISQETIDSISARLVSHKRIAHDVFKKFTEDVFTRFPEKQAKNICNHFYGTLGRKCLRNTNGCIVEGHTTAIAVYSTCYEKAKKNNIKSDSEFVQYGSSSPNIVCIDKMPEEQKTMLNNMYQYVNDYNEFDEVFDDSRFYEQENQDQTPTKKKRVFHNSVLIEKIHSTDDIYFIKELEQTPLSANHIPFYENIITGGIINMIDLYETVMKIFRETDKEAFCQFSIDYINTDSIGFSIVPDPMFHDHTVTHEEIENMIKDKLKSMNVLCSDPVKDIGKIRVKSFMDDITFTKLKKSRKPEMESIDTDTYVKYQHGSLFIGGGGVGKSYTLRLKILDEPDPSKIIVLTKTAKARDVIKLGLHQKDPEKAGPYMNRCLDFDEFFLEDNVTSWISQCEDLEAIYIDEIFTLEQKFVSLITQIVTRYPNIRLICSGDCNQTQPIEDENTCTYDYSTHRTISDLFQNVTVLSYIEEQARYSVELKNVIDLYVNHQNMTYPSRINSVFSSSIEENSTIGMSLMELFNLRDSEQLQNNSVNIDTLFKKFDVNVHTKQEHFIWSHLCRSNTTKRNIDKMCMNMYLKLHPNYETISWEYNGNEKQKQSVTLCKGMRIVCRRNNKMSVDGKVFKVSNSMFLEVSSVNTHDESVTLKFTEFDYLPDITVDRKMFMDFYELGYCNTIFRHQGSEITERFGIHDIDKFNQNDFYTAITRAKKLDDIFVNGRIPTRFKKPEYRSVLLVLEPRRIGIHGIVYKISCEQEPNLVYVGITVAKSKSTELLSDESIKLQMEKRFREHCRSTNERLSDDMKKYGKDAFVIERLDYRMYLNEASLRQKETEFIAKFQNDGYDVYNTLQTIKDDKKKTKEIKPSVNKISEKTYIDPYICINEEYVKCMTYLPKSTKATVHKIKYSKKSVNPVMDAISRAKEYIIKIYQESHNVVLNKTDILTKTTKT